MFIGMNWQSSRPRTRARSFQVRDEVRDVATQTQDRDDEARGSNEAWRPVMRSEEDEEATEEWPPATSNAPTRNQRDAQGHREVRSAVAGTPKINRESTLRWTVTRHDSAGRSDMALTSEIHDAVAGSGPSCEQHSHLCRAARDLRNEPTPPCIAPRPAIHESAAPCEHVCDLDLAPAPYNVAPPHPVLQAPVEPGCHERREPREHVPVSFVPHDTDAVVPPAVPQQGEVSDAVSVSGLCGEGEYEVPGDGVCEGVGQTGGAGPSGSTSLSEQAGHTTCHPGHSDEVREAPTSTSIPVHRECKPPCDEQHASGKDVGTE